MNRQLTTSRAALQPNEGPDIARSIPSRTHGFVADLGVDPVSASGDQLIDGVLYDLKYEAVALTYSFPTSGSQYESVYGSDEPTNGFEAFTAAQKAAVTTILKSVSTFCLLTFSKVSGGGGDLRYAESDGPGDVGAPAYAYLPGAFPEAGDVWTNHTAYEGASLVVGSYAWRSMMHETGHALGLVHGHDDGDNPFGALPTEFDGHEFSLMTYKSYIGDEPYDGYENETYGHPQTYMMADIAALQYLYGANYGAGSNPGATVYTWDADTGETFIDGVGQGEPGANVIFRTIWDGGGTDTYDLSNYTTNLIINLGPGEWSIFSSDQLADLDVTSASTDRIARGNVANALLFDDDPASLIENAEGGSGKDKITGNDAINTLTGNGGNDTLKGANGNDTLLGGAGKDSLTGGKGKDTQTGGGSADTFAYAKLTDSTNAKPDVITDFGAGDKIDVSKIDADAGVAGNQAFHLDGTTGGAGDIGVAYDAAHDRTIIKLYVDAGAAIDATIWLSGDHSDLTAADFVL